MVAIWIYDLMTLMMEVGCWSARVGVYAITGIGNTEKGVELRHMGIR